VGHARYVQFFEAAFIEFWRDAVGPMPEMIAQGVDLAVAELNVRYFAPARFDDVLEIAVTAREADQDSVLMRFDGRVRGGLAIRAEIRYVPIRADGGGREKVPEPIVRVLVERLERG